MEGKPVVRRVVCTAWAERSARWDREWHRLSLNWHPLYESEEKYSNQRNPSELGEEEDDDFLARSDEEKRKKEEEQNEDGAWFNKPSQSKARSPIIAFFFSHFLYFFFINLLQKKKNYHNSKFNLKTNVVMIFLFYFARLVMDYCTYLGGDIAYYI